MAEEIVNRVAGSSLITIDLDEFYIKSRREIIDIKDWLEGGVVLRETNFREALGLYDWKKYKDTYVAIVPVKDAIVPAWAYILITSYLVGIAKKIVLGDLATLEAHIFQEIIDEMDISEYKDKPIIIKGCSKYVPEIAYVYLLEKLQPIAKRIMYGEACSSVPIYRINKGLN